MYLNHFTIFAVPQIFKSNWKRKKIGIKDPDKIYPDNEVTALATTEVNSNGVFCSQHKHGYLYTQLNTEIRLSGAADTRQKDVTIYFQILLFHFSTRFF